MGREYDMYNLCLIGFVISVELTESVHDLPRLSEAMICLPSVRPCLEHSSSKFVQLNNYKKVLDSITMMKAGTKIPGNYCQKPFIALTDRLDNVLSVLAVYTCCL